MKDNPDNDKAPDSSHGKRVLGRISKDDRDSELEPAPEGTPEAPPGIERGRFQQRKSSKSSPRISHRRPPRGDTSSDDKPSLPEDALVAMWRSGGLRFTSKGVVIYRDGRVTTEGTGFGAARQSPAQWLSDAEFAELYRALGTARLHELPSTRDQGPGVRGQGFGVETDSFPELHSTSGRANPDAYAYEVAAKIGPNTYTVEVFDGSVPEQLAPLIEFLSKRMRPAR